MAIHIEMPKLSDTMTEGTLVKWRKKEGDSVEVGDILAEVETDKATMEMEAFDDGILHKILIPEGSKIEVGGTLAILIEEGEEPPAEGEMAGAPKAKAAKAEAGPAESKGAPAAAAPAAPVTSSGGRVKASPLAKKVAAELGVDLAGVNGTGPGGRVVEKDVRTASGGAAPGPKPQPVTAAQLTGAPAAAVSAGAEERIPLSGMRRVIAQRLLESKTQIPHFYLNIEVDAGPLMKFRASINEAGEGAGLPKITVNDFVLKAVVAAAQAVPMVNASFTPEAIIKYGSINLSVAVAVDEGLVTPVVRDAQTKSLRQISEAVKDLATRARNKKLKPEEYAGGTITVSNLGAYGIESFSAIVNPPQVVIIAVGTVVKKPVVDKSGQIVVGQRMAVGLSCDHRVVDGAIGAQYLAELRRLLESPALMLL